MDGTSAQSWKKESGFIWSVIGSVVGFANILSFSALCYKNGGGAFLIPYLCAFLVLGLPMLFLEGIIGQKWNLPFVSSYGKAFGRKGKMLGWMAVIACLTIGAFYIVLTAYASLYAYFAISGQIPEDTAGFFKNTFLQSTPSIEMMGRFSWQIFLAVAALGILTWWILTRGIQKGIEKVCSFFMPLLTILVLVFAIIASFLPGAFVGISNYLTPDFSKLGDFNLWRDVFGQLFFSLSLGLGIITGYSQYNGKSINLRKAMKWVAIGDFSISFVAGWIIFACIGYMSVQSGIAFEDIVQSDSAFEIGFIIFPTIIKSLTPWLQPFIGLLFFFSVFVAGITGLFSILESIAGNIQSESGRSRRWAVSVSISCCCLLSMFFCMGNGQHLIGALAPMVLGINMIFGALMEIIAFLFINADIRQDSIWKPHKRYGYAYYSLKYCVPFILLAILLGTIGEEFKHLGISEAIRWSWFLAAAGVAFFCSKSEAKCTITVKTQSTTL